MLAGFGLCERTQHRVLHTHLELAQHQVRQPSNFSERSRRTYPTDKIWQSSSLWSRRLFLHLLLRSLDLLRLLGAGGVRERGFFPEVRQGAQEIHLHRGAKASHLPPPRQNHRQVQLHRAKKTAPEELDEGFCGTGGQELLRLRIIALESARTAIFTLHPSQLGDSCGRSIRRIRLFAKLTYSATVDLQINLQRGSPVHSSPCQAMLAPQTERKRSWRFYCYPTLSRWPQPLFCCGRSQRTCLSRLCAYPAQRCSTPCAVNRTETTCTQLRMGKVAGICADEARRTAKLLKLRNTLQNLAQVSALLKM